MESIPQVVCSAGVMMDGVKYPMLLRGHSRVYLLEKSTYVVSIHREVYNAGEMMELTKYLILLQGHSLPYLRDTIIYAESIPQEACNAGGIHPPSMEPPQMVHLLPFNPTIPLPAGFWTQEMSSVGEAIQTVKPPLPSLLIVHQS